MITVLRQRNFALLWWSGLISFTGDWMLGIARPLFVYQLTGSALATSLMFIAGALPRVVLASVVGVFIDRWDRQRLMVIANLLLAMSVLPLLLVRTPELLWILYVSAFCTSALAQFLYPAENALLPTLISEEHLVPANALNSLNNNLSRLIGPSVGGLLMAAAGFGAVVMVEAVTYVIAAALISLIRTDAAPAKAERTDAETEAVDAKAQLERVWREWWAGIQLVRGHRALGLIFVVSAITAIGEGAFSVLFAPFAADILQTGSAGVGVLMSAQAVGGLLGGMVIARLGERLPLWQMLGWGALLLGLIDAVLFNYSLLFNGLWFAILTLVIVGVPAAGFLSSAMTLLQKNTDDRYRGRVFGALVTTSAVFSLIGMGLAGTLGEVFGAWLINIQVVVYVITGVIVLTRRPDRSGYNRVSEHGLTEA